MTNEQAIELVNQLQRDFDTDQVYNIVSASTHLNNCDIENKSIKEIVYHGFIAGALFALTNIQIETDD